MPHDIFKKYQIVQDNKVSKYPKKDGDNFLANAFKTEKPDIYFQKKVIIDHFKEAMIIEMFVK